MSVKIKELDIKTCNNTIFGEWLTTDSLKIETFPYDHIILDDFLKQPYYESVCKVLPEKPSEHWWNYENPLEVKYALDKFEYMDPLLKNVFYALAHETIIKKLRTLFSIPNLEFDPYCHGGGLHMYPQNGRLNMHLDYEKHPITNKQRRLNIILYLNDTWDSSWNGDTQLWDSTMTECKVRSYPKANTAIVFVTTENSWHGVPKIIECPADIYRKSLAYYYVSDIENRADTTKYGCDSTGYRNKAVFVNRPQDLPDSRMSALYKIRPYRLITKEDMKTIWPEWTPALTIQTS
jgi:Rps23 Pro-64 3,4-dihydroxylase Tpa1-like proline 4-hydroxylase